MSRNFDYPADLPLTDGNGRITHVWGQWFSRAHNAAASLYQSGTTANRPASLLWIGRQYFDTDLGKPVWVQSVKPTVWVDATGAAV